MSYKPTTTDGKEDIMEMDEYQHLVRETDQRDPDDEDGIVVHLLGLAGEAGSIATTYKKRIRDGSAHAWFKAQMREELGDLLWYLSTVSSRTGLDLSEIATANIEKTRRRWLSSTLSPLDDRWPPTEQLPRTGTYEFRATNSDTGRPAVTVWFEGTQVGSLLTDASGNDDGYRFHDVFHLSYASLLGWSPVSRGLLGRKRRSDQAIDENEDGGRSMVIEEGIAALVFAYASQHEYLAGIERLDQQLLDTIAMLVGPTEVGGRSASAWEDAILKGFNVFRQLVDNNGGYVDFDFSRREFNYRTP